MDSSLRLGVSAAAAIPTGLFSHRFEALFPHARPLGCIVCLTPQLFLLVYLHAIMELPAQPAATLPRVLSAHAACLLPSYWSG